MNTYVYIYIYIYIYIKIQTERQVSTVASSSGALASLVRGAPGQAGLCTAAACALLVLCWSFG